MKAKIEWYKEVVDLEPSSKLFFPLAKMLAEHDVPSAIKTLQIGLERNPEFIEARFFFVELLYKHSSIEEYALLLKKQIDILAPKLSKYALFWQAWGKDIIAEHGVDDKSLAISLLGVMCEDNGLSLSDILLSGLQNVMCKFDNTSKSTQKTTVEPVAKSSKIIKMEPNSFNFQVQARQSNFQLEDFENEEIDEEIDNRNENDIGNVSLRTRSMAEIFAEQGDYTAALNIYNELISESESDTEKDELQEKIEQVKELMNNPVEFGTNNASKGVKVISPGKEKVISVLESLGDRLNKRASL